MNKDQIKKAAQIIRNGGLVAFPTETVYGLGANALNPLAVAKIFEKKERPRFDPLIVHIASVNDLSILTSQFSEIVRELAQKFWPGPLTLVLPKTEIVPEIVTSGLPTVGIRMPNNPMALQLIKEANCPIAAPSANKFGKLSPVTASHVRKQLPDVDFILDGGSTEVGIESTIISIDGNECTLLRPGVITLEEIEQAIPGKFVFKTAKTGKITAPGLLPSHYSPVKPLFILSHDKTTLPDFSGVILHKKNSSIQNSYKTIFTSLTNNYLEIAANLFNSLHELEDDNNIKQIYIEPVIEEGLGIAIMDRIKKAAYQYLSNSKSHVGTNKRKPGENYAGKGA